MNHIEQSVLKELKSGHKRWTFAIDVRRFFTDVNGAIIDKALVPAKFKIKYPIYMIGDFDKNGGYRQAQNVRPPLPGIVYLTSFVVGGGFSTFNIVGFSGVDTIKDQLLPGDIVNVFTDSNLNPSIFIWIVQQNTFGALGSILNNFSTMQDDKHLGPIKLKNANYYALDVNNQSVTDQFDEDWFMTTTDNIGNQNTNSIRTATWLTPETKQTGFVRVQLDWSFTQYLGVNFYMIFNTDFISVNFNLNQ